MSVLIPALVQAAVLAAAAPVDELLVLKAEAASILPLLKSPAARAFIESSALLPHRAPRVLWRDAEHKIYITDAEQQALPQSERERFERYDVDEETYYTTRYGSPLSYARPLEILSSRQFGGRALEDLKGKRLLDFGYGYVSHLRMLATLGVDAHGVDVDPMLHALYSEPDDVGVMKGQNGAAGKVTLHAGRWPAEPLLAAAVGGGYDVIVSKNVLKRGYIHPDRAANPKHLVDLGVDDATFLQAVFAALKPGGRMLVFNICPAAAPPDKPFIPWADGRSPFSKQQWEAAGFKVLALDVNDDKAVRAMANALSWDQAVDGAPGMDLEKDLFAWFTLVEKPAGRP